jgi:hypothetical protein
MQKIKIEFYSKFNLYFLGNFRDVFIQGDTDDKSQEIVEKLEWKEQFQQISQIKYDP